MSVGIVSEQVGVGAAGGDSTVPPAGYEDLVPEQREVPRGGFQTRYCLASEALA